MKNQKDWSGKNLLCKKIPTAAKNLTTRTGGIPRTTRSLTTGLDAGLRVSEDSMLVACEDGNFKFVIYDNDSRDKDIIAIYKIDQIDYNITSAKAIATII